MKEYLVTYRDGGWTKVRGYNIAMALTNAPGVDFIIRIEELN